MTDQHFIVDFEPIGRRIPVKPGTDLLTAAQLAGVDLLAVCGGTGICGVCRVRLISGELTPLTFSEQQALDDTQISSGYRLACQAQPRSHVRLEIPPESLPSGQKMQVDGKESELQVAPVVTGSDLELKPPDLHDLRSDLTRALDQLGEPSLEANVAALAQLSAVMRQEDWCVRLALGKTPRGSYLSGSFSPGTRLLGLAADMGSTKLAFYLVDLASGATLAQMGVMNPQISYGEDVVSRIAYANRSEENRVLLQTRLVETIQQSAGELCAQTGMQTGQIVDAVLVGNTAMHHFFAGLPVHQLGASPYVPAVSEALLLRADEVGLTFSPGMRVYLPANIAGYVGADHTAALLSSRVYQDGTPQVLVDIGTNTEISLVHAGKIHSCSTASGPAFEGAHIRDGMRAAPGAIDSLHITQESVLVTTIEAAKPVGICGTGILKAISEMLDAGLLDERGSLNRNDTRVRTIGRKTEFPLVSAGQSGHGREIAVTRKDVNEIQLAKGAIRSGIDILLAEAGLDASQVQHWVIAGAFGTYLDLGSAVRIGMFPDVPLERFSQVGNAAGMGAKQMLLSQHLRTEASQVARSVNYIELTAYPAFTDIFLKNMYFKAKE